MEKGWALVEETAKLSCNVGRGGGGVGEGWGSCFTWLYESNERARNQQRRDLNFCPKEKVGSGMAGREKE